MLNNHPRWGLGMDVTILLGSSSDLPIAQKCTKILEHFDVPYQLRVASAHRSPKFVEEIVGDALEVAARCSSPWLVLPPPYQALLLL